CAVVQRRPVPRVIEDCDRSGSGESGSSQIKDQEPPHEEALQVRRILSRMPDDLQLPGFVNAHSHAFQRALRGRSEGSDFWAWRDAMLELAGAQSPARVRGEYAAVYREMRAAGFTAVGEFHYLGLPEAHAAVEAGRE